ncbi:MAG: ANTAR domain-containing protein, partial [Pseudomonadota bacterium]
PVVVFADDDPERLAAAAIRSGISSFVIDGLEVGRVRPVLEIALERFRMIRALQTELEKSQERLAARKTVEQAKGLLMQHRAMTEQQAYKTLRDMAMRQGKPLKIIAENIIAMSDLLP